MLFKLDNITNLTSARWAAAEGFDAISFNFDKSNINYITPMKAVEICQWISGLKVVGNFKNLTPSAILDIYNLLNLDAIEIDLTLTDELLLNQQVPIILSVESSGFIKELDFEKLYPFLLAFSYNSNSNVSDNYPIEKSFFPSIFSPQKLSKVPFGINFDSANETEIGIADFEELEFFKQKWEAI
jgi:phosphoribosylanthranilate isomerase